MILNETRRVPKNRRHKQKRTAKMLGIELQPRWPEHPSIKRLMHASRYARYDEDNYTLGDLWRLWQRPTYSFESRVHKCKTLGSALARPFASFQVSICKHHRNNPPDSIDGMSSSWSYVGADWLKQYLPDAYEQWLEQFVRGGKAIAKSRIPSWMMRSQPTQRQRADQMRMAHAERANEYERCATSWIEVTLIAQKYREEEAAQR